MAADDIRLDSLPLHLAQQPQGLLGPRAFLAGANRGAEADDLGFDTRALHLAQQLQGLLELRALRAGADDRAVAL